MNVLPKDENLALKLKNCCQLSLHRALSAAMMDRIDEADRWVKEFERCKRDLDELIRKKEEHDKLLEVVEMMKERGVDIAIIMRKGGMNNELHTKLHKSNNR